jgi:hypothetical protein
MVDTAQIAGFPVAYPGFTKEGQRAFPLTFDFTAIASYTTDLETQFQNGMFKALQTVFFDNADNANPATLLFSPVGPRIVIAKQSQGYFPIALVNPPRFTLSTTIAAISVRLIFYNFPVAQTFNLSV